MALTNIFRDIRTKDDPVVKLTFGISVATMAITVVTFLILVAIIGINALG